MHKTVAGKSFECVGMARKLMAEGAPPHCGYSVVRSIYNKPVPFTV